MKITGSISLIPKIIYEDDFMLVVNKPSGMVVNKAETTKQMMTLQDWLIQKGRGKEVERNGIVHRLDKETSGVLVIAKTSKAMEYLQSQFKQRQVQKTYLSLAHGIVSPETGVISAMISRNPFNRKRFGVFLGGREAETSYQVIKVYQSKHGKFSLLSVTPKTGRTHQIRVHLKYINHPVVGDELYGGRKTARKDRGWCPRMFLHAAKISIKIPVSGVLKEFESPLEPELEAVLEKIKKD